tara:strand:+ start:85 stop:774 length:690 start_codon:yes stop_codon:yes gene_type:complete
MTKVNSYTAILLIEKTNFTDLIIKVFSKTLNKSFKKKIVKVNSDKELNNLKKIKNIDFLFNFQHRILGKEILKNIKYPINFHSGSTRYPGRGGYAWAIFEKSKYYGCTAHIMEKKVDSGKIIEEVKFPLEGFESIEIIKFKCFLTNMLIFYGILSKLNISKKIIYKKTKWKRKTLKLNDLKKINTFEKKTPKKIKNLIIRATEYYPYGPYVKNKKNFKKFKIKKKIHII